MKIVETLILTMVGKLSVKNLASKIKKTKQKNKKPQEKTCPETLRHENF